MGNTREEMMLERIIADVIAEGRRAQKKHGTPMPNPLRGSTILMEEAGEAAEAALKLTSRDEAEREGQTDEFWLKHLRKELIECASVAIRQIVNIDTGRTLPWVVRQREAELLWSKELNTEARPKEQLPLLSANSGTLTSSSEPEQSTLDIR